MADANTPDKFAALFVVAGPLDCRFPLGHVFDPGRLDPLPYRIAAGVFAVANDRDGNGVPIVLDGRLYRTAEDAQRAIDWAGVPD